MLQGQRTAGLASASLLSTASKSLVAQTQEMSALKIILYTAGYIRRETRLARQQFELSTGRYTICRVQTEQRRSSFRIGTFSSNDQDTAIPVARVSREAGRMTGLSLSHTIFSYPPQQAPSDTTLPLVTKRLVWRLDGTPLFFKRNWSRNNCVLYIEVTTVVNDRYTPAPDHPDVMQPYRMYVRTCTLHRRFKSPIANR
jgi:hypothetical protein